MTLSFFAVMFGVLFCLAVGIRDMRRKEYLWASFAMVAAALLIITPFPGHALKIDLPIAD